MCSNLLLLLSRKIVVGFSEHTSLLLFQLSSPADREVPEQPDRVVDPGRGRLLEPGDRKSGARRLGNAAWR